MTFANYAATHAVKILTSQTSGKQMPIEILEYLMKEAVEKCKAHSGDILYDFDSIREAIENIDSAMYADGFFWCMGFREYGEDHLTFIECRFDGSADSLKANYKSIYQVEMTPEEYGYISWELSRIDF